ncbi:hypothetical protein RDI58_021992 [Solanum bulbocastanum]|uniref:Uncharacterized protein n=1 Tax=Solanum bulbocastanum TaxID=147425 RepID=A0AAN8T195_SOLBU
MNIDGIVENEVVSDLNEDDLNLNGVDTDLLGAETCQNEVDTYLPNSDTYVNAIPNEDKSDVDEELRSFREKKEKQKKLLSLEEESNT